MQAYTWELRAKWCWSYTGGRVMVCLCQGRANNMEKLGCGEWRNAWLRKLLRKGNF